MLEEEFEKKIVDEELLLSTVKQFEPSLTVIESPMWIASISSTSYKISRWTTSRDPLPNKSIY